MRKLLWAEDHPLVSKHIIACLDKLQCHSALVDKDSMPIGLAARMSSCSFLGFIHAAISARNNSPE